MFASAICVRAGAVSQAAFEIIRQAWIISIQVGQADCSPGTAGALLSGIGFIGSANSVPGQEEWGC